MRELESKYRKELVVIGVHSGKYHAERVTSRIRDASVRLGGIHPIINDRQFRTWRSYAVSAWPTLAVVDPRGYVVGARAGEFSAQMLVPFVDALIQNAREAAVLNEEEMRFGADEPTTSPGVLMYPGKVAIDGNRIAIADSGHHRVIIARLTDEPDCAKIEQIAGGDERGFEDGLHDARFSSPQGLEFAGSKLFVADAENHAVRAVNPGSGEVTTLAGIGRQLRSRADLEAGAMSSPWDLTMIGDSLFVAMAGRHQLWEIDLRSRRACVHSGTGGEDIRDGENRTALLAQPMGITGRGSELHFADSESNAIRRSDVSETGSVSTIVGTGLFDFGDTDGTGDDVRLQHPQGIAYGPDGKIFVADSYNDCIKIIEPQSRRSTVWVRGLNEPSGIACSATHAYVADTNAHRVVAIDLNTREIAQVRLE